MRFKINLQKWNRESMFSTWFDFKDLTRGKASDKVLRYREFNTAKNPKCDGYECGLASVVYKPFGGFISRCCYMYYSHRNRNCFWLTFREPRISERVTQANH